MSKNMANSAGFNNTADNARRKKAPMPPVKMDDEVLAAALKATASLRSLKDRLKDRLEDVLVEVLGDPSSQTDREWRWGNHGSLSIGIIGDKRGIWNSFEDIEGGDIMKLLGWKWKLEPGAELTEKAIELLNELPSAPHLVSRKTLAADLNRWTDAEAIEEFWKKADQLREGGETAWAYTESRAINPSCLSHDEVRQVQHRSSKTATSFPSMVFPVRNGEGIITGVHAIRLQGDRKLQNAAKMSNGTLKGGAIMFGDASNHDVMLLVEGPEDAMSLYYATGLPVWASMSVGGLGSVPLPPCKTVIVFGDADETRKETKEQVAKLAQRHPDVRVVFPDGDHKDANDILMADPDPANPIVSRDKYFRMIASATPLGGTKSGNRRRLISMAEMIAKLGPTDWLIENHLEADTLSLMYGKPKTGKSFIALDMVLCIATGLPYHGMPVKQGGVVYIVGEGHGGLARRVKAWCIEHGDIDPDTLPILCTSKGQPLPEREEVEALMLEIDMPIKLVVVDTLNRNFGGKNEDSTQDMTAFIANVDLLRVEQEATVLIVHHSGLSNDNRARGNSSLFGAVDALMKVSQSQDTIKLEIEVFKDAETPPPIAFTKNVIEFDVGDGETANSIVLRKGEGRATEKAKDEFYAEYPELRRKSGRDKFGERLPKILSAMYGGETNLTKIAEAYGGKAKSSISSYISRLRGAGLVGMKALNLTPAGRAAARKLDPILVIAEAEKEAV